MLAEYMSRERISSRELAFRVGVDPSYIIRIKSGDRKHPTLDVVEALARGLDLTHMETVKLVMSFGLLPRGLKYSDELYELIKNDEDV